MNSRPLAGLRRPRILISTARNVQRQFKGKSGMRRLIKANQKLSRDSAIRLLKQQGSGFEAIRISQDGTYNARRHVQTLAALMAECQILKSDKAVGH